MTKSNNNIPHTIGKMKVKSKHKHATKNFDYMTIVDRL